MRTPLHCCIVLLVLIARTSSAAGAEPVKLWHENRLTPEQPFPARVVAVIASWNGYALLLEEMAEKKPRYCIAQLWAAHDLDYKIVPDKKAFRDVHDSHKATYLSPGVEVDSFSWSIGTYTFGRR